jgi:hypothetical protein
LLPQRIAAAFGNLAFADAELGHVVLRQIDAVFLPIYRHVLQEVDQLQRRTDAI